MSWENFPKKNLPEIAIVGRSNCGKSSLINALAHRKVAKVSQTPGKTRLLNIFDVGTRCFLVDMPGYGFAARSVSERKSWQKMIENYFFESERLCGLMLLMDSRRDWSEDEDLLFQFAESQGLPVMLGLTKADKFSRSRGLAKLKEVKAGLDIPVFLLSSPKKKGVNEFLGYALKNWLDKKEEPKD